MGMGYGYRRNRDWNFLGVVIVEFFPWTWLANNIIEGSFTLPTEKIFAFLCLQLEFVENS